MSDERPGILTAIAILGIILGALGLLGGLGGIAGAVVQDQVMDLPGADETQQQLAAEMVEMTRAYMVPTVIGAVANLVVSGLLILGGSWLLVRKPAGIPLMRRTVIAAIVVDLYSAALGLYVQVKILPATQQMMRAAAAAAPGPAGAPAADAAMESVMAVAMWTSLAFAVFWLVCKLAYYIVTLVALKKPDVTGWIAAEGAAA